jgi:hypothetical protein
MLNYKKLMAQDPVIYDIITNSIGQEVLLVEHPTKGDEAQVICVSRELSLAAYSGFYDTGDMTADHGEYEPSFKDGLLLIGGFISE